VTTKIYVLHDGDGAVRYIGKTRRSLPSRLAGHLQDARNGKTSRKSRWIQNMISVGRFPEITLVGEAQGNGNREEIAWIAYGRSVGWELTNGTDGGSGDRRASGCRGVSFWFSGEICAELKRRSVATGKSKSEIVDEALRISLGMPQKEGRQ
jgi:hypothetical protein